MQILILLDEVGLRFCILDKLPGDVDPVGPWVTLQREKALEDLVLL